MIDMNDKTNSQKNQEQKPPGVLGYSLMLLPPFLLLPLATIPFDIWTVIFWAPAGLIALICCVSLLVRVVLIGIRGSHSRRLLGLIRPALTIAVFLGSF